MKKIADALDGHAAAGASLAPTAVAPLLVTPARRAADHEDKIRYLILSYLDHEQLFPCFQPEPSRAATSRAHHGRRHEASKIISTTYDRACLAYFNVLHTRGVSRLVAAQPFTCAESPSLQCAVYPSGLIEFGLHGTGPR